MKQIKCCLYCNYRYVGCHSKCEQYLKEKAEYEKEKAEMDKIKAYEKEYNSHKDVVMRKHGKTFGQR